MQLAFCFFLFYGSISLCVIFIQNARIHGKLRQDIEMDQTLWHPGIGDFSDSSSLAPSPQDRKTLSFTPAFQM